LETIYLICFAIGFLYALATIIFGSVFDVEMGLDGGSLPFISPITIASFITVFGGTGLFLSSLFPWAAVIILLISMALALVGAFGMFFIVVIPLHKAQKSAAFSNKDMIGKFAEVATSIIKKERGEIIYEQGGSRLSAPALTVDHKTILQGEIVEIVDVVSGTFVVKVLEK
jgi:membrane-bound ClpP family serine protease